MIGAGRRQAAAAEAGIRETRRGLLDQVEIETEKKKKKKMMMMKKMKMMMNE